MDDWLTDTSFYVLLKKKKKPDDLIKTKSSSYAKATKTSLAVTLPLLFQVFTKSLGFALERWKTSSDIVSSRQPPRHVFFNSK